jgi:hypothetical protein
VARPSCSKAAAIADWIAEIPGFEFWADDSDQRVAAAGIPTALYENSFPRFAVAAVIVAPHHKPIIRPPPAFQFSGQTRLKIRFRFGGNAHEIEYWSQPREKGLGKNFYRPLFQQEHEAAHFG